MSVRLTSSRQRGVALITALLIVALVVSVLSSLFWQQGLSFQRLSKQRERTQLMWLERAAIDWVAVILKSTRNQATINLGQIWAVPVAEISLKEFLQQNKIEDTQLAQQKAYLLGALSDAQGRYNLFNIVAYSPEQKKYLINPVEIAVLKRLMTELQLSPDIAQQLANTLEQRFNQTLSPSKDQGTVQKTATLPQNLENFLPILGVNDKVLRRLQEFMFYYPEALAINLNTAPLEVIHAVVPELDIGVLRVVFQNRDRVYARDNANFFNLVGRPELASRYTNAQVDVKSKLFFLSAQIKVNDVTRALRALLDNNGKIIWRQSAS